MWQLPWIWGDSGFGYQGGLVGGMEAEVRGEGYATRLRGEKDRRTELNCLCFLKKII